MTREATPWRTVKIRSPSADVIGEIQALVRAHGITHLDPVAAEVLRAGVSAGDVVGAALALLRAHVTTSTSRARSGAKKG